MLEESQAKMAVRRRKRESSEAGDHPYEVDFLWVSLLCEQISIKTDVSPQSWHLPEMLILKVISLVEPPGS